VFGVIIKFVYPLGLKFLRLITLFPVVKVLILPPPVSIFHRVVIV